MMPAGEWREPIAPLRVLVSCGWLSDTEARHPDTRVEATSSSHVVVRVVAPDGRSAVVKQVPRAAAAAGRGLRQELFVYRLARSVPALAAALPTPIHIDESRQVLAMAAVGGNPVPSLPGLSTPGVAERLAASMAGWHQSTQEIGLWPSPASGILDMPDALVLAAEGRAQPARDLMTAIVADRDLADTLRAARAAWRDRCLIHGDIRRENWIATIDVDHTAVAVIDWELSGSGDPAWDLAGVLGEIVIDAVRAGHDPAGEWSDEQAGTARRFVRAYTRAGGLIGPNADEWHHVVRCAVARLLHVAIEWAEAHAAEHVASSAPLLSGARALLARQARWADDLRRWAIP